MLKKLFKKRTPHQEFWDWFVKNQQDFYLLIEPYDQLFDALHEQLLKVNSGLTFEFSTTTHASKREFVISADGIRDVFSDVIKLVNCAPTLDQWKITAFRQRSSETEIIYNSVHLKTEDVRFTYSIDSQIGKPIDIVLFIRDFVKNDDWIGALYILLDSILGEFDVETKLGKIEYYSQEQQFTESTLPISELPKIVDSYFPTQ